MSNVTLHPDRASRGRPCSFGILSSAGKCHCPNKADFVTRNGSGWCAEHKPRWTQYLECIDPADHLVGTGAPGPEPSFLQKK
jgi:hypothetical protein